MMKHLKSDTLQQDFIAFDESIADYSTNDSCESTPLIVESAIPQSSNNYLPDISQTDFKFIRSTTVNVQAMKKMTSINSKALELFFKTVDPSFFVIPYVFQREGLGVALFFLCEFQFFAYLSGRAFIEIKQIHSQLQRCQTYKSNFLLFDIIDYFIESKNVNIYFKALIFTVFGFYAVGGIVFTAHVFASLFLSFNAMVVQGVFVTAIFALLIVTHRNKSLHSGNVLKMVMFLLITSIIIYQCSKQFKHERLPFYTYDIDDTFGIWSFSFFLPFIAILSKSFDKINPQEQIYTIYTRYNILSLIAKTAYGLSISMLITSQILEKSLFGFENYVLTGLLSLMTILFVLPSLQETVLNIDKACTKLDILYVKEAILLSIFALSMTLGLLEKQAIVSFINYSSIFINFQFINIVPFALLYYGLCQLESSQTDPYKYRGGSKTEFGISDISDSESNQVEYGSVQTGSGDEKEGDCLVMKSVDRVFNISLLKRYFFKGQVQRAKYWTLGFVTSGLKTIIFMSCLVLYSLIFK